MSEKLPTLNWLQSIEYNALMMAINEAKNSIQEDNFIDPFAPNPDGYTNTSLLAALSRVEDRIIKANLPD